jgi:hypothetical protein|tara:strand:+ start:14 stop:670 length:657 start_codon:yes stop_codon:yes gene_type:complete
LLTPETTVVNKLFYKVYPYRITYPRLGNLPSFYWDDNKPSEGALAMRFTCLHYLKSNFKTQATDTHNRIKFNNGYHTHVYFSNKEDYLLAKEHSKELHINYTIPLREDLKEILDEYDQKVEIRQTLYLKEHRYKATLSYNYKNFPKVCDDIFETFGDNENYKISGNIKSVTNRFGYYGAWATYSIYCKSKIDVEYFTFMFGEDIKSISKIVLVSELDK